jgi:hypothetical protein
MPTLPLPPPCIGLSCAMRMFRWIDVGHDRQTQSKHMSQLYYLKADVAQ